MSKITSILALSAIVLTAFIAISLSNQNSQINIVTQTQPKQLMTLECGFTADFTNFLKSNGYSSWGFDRPDIRCANYGGRNSSTQKIKKTPIIFVHGNSDVAFGRGTQDGYVSWQTGFRSLATYLTAQGYEESELYTTTWGPADPNKASDNFHSKAYVTYMRAFLEAVMAYTGAKQVDVIGHSMGVSIGRKIIKGGSATDHSAGTYNVGASLSSKVRNFIGLAGANYGLTACYSATIYPTCGKVDGFFPGALPSSGPSTYLNDVNVNGGAEASKVYTIWSKFDDLIGMQCLVWGKSTCRIPGQTAQVVKTSAQWTHFAVRDNTGPDLIGWLA